MISPRLDSSNSCQRRRPESIPRPSPTGTEGSESFDSARLGVIVCLLFMAGGLYWTASVGLLTISALKAYPVMICVGGALLALFTLVTSFWTSRSPEYVPQSELMAPDSITSGLSTYDSVTGLPTKRLFSSLLKQDLSNARKYGRHVAVLLVEMDHFTLTTELHREVNRNLVYRVQAARVKSALRTTDCVGRLAERTFAVLLDNVASTEEVIAAAKKMQAMVSLPFMIEGQEIFLTSRIGISLSTSDDDEGAALIESASQAVSIARAEGYAVYGLSGMVVAPSVESTSIMAA
jgi:diguanylate cyclase (GGDEF)-like protein